MKRSTTISPSIQKKIALFRSYFSGLPNEYGIRDPKSDRQFQVKRPVTDRVLLGHLQGKHHYGVYLLNGSRTKAIVADFDKPDPIRVIEFFNTAHRYDLSASIEKSKSKGYHVWIFFETASVAAYKARLVVRHMLKEIENPNVEIFPKHDRLDNQITSGNYILAPLFGGLVLRGKTVFVDPATMKPYSDQWEYLSAIRRVPESVLEDVIEINQLGEPSLETETNIETPTPGKNVFGLPVCAQKMLQAGVSHHQRVSCFRLAVHLKRIGLSYDMAVATLKIWSQQNRPASGKQVITNTEITTQTSYAFTKGYSGYGCGSEAVDPYCDPSCPVNKYRKRVCSKHDSTPFN